MWEWKRYTHWPLGMRIVKSEKDWAWMQVENQAIKFDQTCANTDDFVEAGYVL